MNIPLVVDLDGTLIQSDLLVESGLSFIRRSPERVVMILFWLLSGKARLKERLAEGCHLDVANLPYDTRVVELIHEAREQGRGVFLATASHRSLADQIAEHLNLFDGVLATEAGSNLTGHRKRDALIQRFGERGYDYIGGGRDDISIWKAARYAYVVNPAAGVAAQSHKAGNVQAVYRRNHSLSLSWLKALRLHQWAKNLLVFVPLLASHRVGEIPLLVDGILAFLFFGICASSAYLLNDLFDLRDDRVHATKCARPFASGQIPLAQAMMAVPVMLMAAFGGAILLLPWEFAVALAGYYVLTLAYSVTLKRRMMVDVISLSMLYTARIIAGTFALQLTLTFWMLAFSTFIFLSLAFVKRYAELREARERSATDKTPGRGYYPNDLEMVASLGGASGFIAVLVLAMYTQEESTYLLYSRPELIWVTCPMLLFWVGRTWMLTHRGEMNEDPVLFAIKDRVSLVVGILFAATFWLAR